MARRFRFPLQTLLKVRQLREREAKRKVAAQHAEIARLDQLDQAARREIAARQSALLDHQRHRYLNPRDLSRGWSWIAHLRSAMAQRQAMRAEMVKELDRLQAEFRAARQQTRIIEKLRERRWDEYSRDRRRREQAAADEVAQQLHLLKRIPEKTWPRRPGHATRSPSAQAAECSVRPPCRTSNVASDPRVERPWPPGQP